MEKIKILESSPIAYDRSSHLNPVIEFLIKQGNTPLSTEFYTDKTGVGEFRFKNRINSSLLKETFDFPENIIVGEDPCYGGGVVWDRGNALIIYADL